MLHVEHLTTLEAVAGLQPVWNDLAAGIPFRTHAWLTYWWRHYGGAQQLMVLVVRDAQGAVLGIAPWYLESSATEGRVIRQLGTGEVCSDYLSILSVADPAAQQRVAAALADYLTGEACPAWELLHLEGIDQDDPLAPALAAELTARDCLAARHEAYRCWRLALPTDWDAYLQLQSKNQRKQLRRSEKEATGRAVLHTCEDVRTLERDWAILVDLHQRRRQSLGEPGCFHSPRFAAFHREVAEHLLAAGQLGLHWLELDGAAVAAEYQLVGEGVTYAYQSGMDPDRVADEPGRIVVIATLQRAIAAGQQAFDFLRGDEPYKAHWRAEPRAAYDYRLVAPHAGARLRHRVWCATGGLKSWIKSTVALVAGDAR